MPITFWIAAADSTSVRYDYDREEEVSPAVLRERFDGGYYCHLAEVSGEMSQAYEYSELAPPEANQPPGTLSQIIILGLTQLNVDSRQYAA